jgi:SNF2 family DNA or RNA helicase
MSLIIKDNLQSIIFKNLINYLDVYNSLYDTHQKMENIIETDVYSKKYENDNEDNKQNKNIKKKEIIINKGEKVFNISSNYEYLINNINNIILDDDKTQALVCINILEKNIQNNLIANILCNSPECDISLLKFNNILTNLYPYQINNINWMLNIEKKIYTEEYNDIKNKIIFKGGGLFDEVGMGKTLQVITLININKTNYNSYIKNNKLFSKATLIIVPNHLCGQWSREFQTHLIKPLNIIQLLTKKHYNKYTYYDIINADVIIISSNFFINCKLNQHEKSDELYNIINIFNTDVNIFNIFWHRVVIDEFHEIEDSNLFIRLKYIESDLRWIISGTPFKECTVQDNIEKTSLSKIVDYLTFNHNTITRIDLINITNYNYIKNHFSRNTHNKNMNILKLPSIIEENIWLKFSDTERMIYNAYIADPNNTQTDIFLRQICCHPTLSDKIRENITSTMNTLNDMKEHMKNMYFKDFDKSDENYNECIKRIDKLTNDLQELKDKNKTDLMLYQYTKEDLERAQIRLIEFKKIRDGKEKTLLYYKNFLELISDMNNIKEQECPICLDKIKEEDIGITICGHIYCYSCISIIIKDSKSTGMPSECPNCRKHLEIDKIFLISENKSKDVDILGTKLAYIINYIKNSSEKYRIIFSQWDYLLKEVGKVLEQNNIKHLYCQGNVYQKDKVLKIFNNKDIQNNDYRIIMLSSDSTVSGSNLNNAEEVIFLDPIYGDKQFRINTENQAIGRVRRLGNKFKEIKVIRLLIKDTIEEEIFKSNQV